MSELLPYPTPKTIDFYFAYDYEGQELGWTQGDSSQMHVATAGTAGTGDSPPDGFLMHMSPCSRASLSVPTWPLILQAIFTWLRLLIARSSQGGHTPYVVGGFQVEEVEVASQLKAIPWMDTVTLPLFPVGQSDHRICSSSRG